MKNISLENLWPFSNTNALFCDIRRDCYKSQGLSALRNLPLKL